MTTCDSCARTHSHLSSPEPLRSTATPGSLALYLSPAPWNSVRGRDDSSQCFRYTLAVTTPGCPLDSCSNATFSPTRLSLLTPSATFPAGSPSHSFKRWEPDHRCAQQPPRLAAEPPAASASVPIALPLGHLGQHSRGRPACSIPQPNCPAPVPSPSQGLWTRRPPRLASSSLDVLSSLPTPPPQRARPRLPSACTSKARALLCPLLHCRVHVWA